VGELTLLDASHPQLAGPCTHHVEALPRRPAPTVLPVSQTPIYDQLRGERINADVPAVNPEPPRADDPEQHVQPENMVAVDPLFARPPGPGADPRVSSPVFPAR
jgi:hypothetical protein